MQRSCFLLGDLGRRDGLHRGEPRQARLHSIFDTEIAIRRISHTTLGGGIYAFGTVSASNILYGRGDFCVEVPCHTGEGEARREVGDQALWTRRPYHEEAEFEC